MSDSVHVPTYPAIRDAQHRYLRTVPGVRLVLGFEPKAVNTWPMIYTLLDAVPVSATGQVQARRYTCIHRLCGPWAGEERAEEILTALVDPILDALGRAAASRLDDLIPSGILELGDVRAGFLTIGGAWQRVIDVTTTALVKGPAIRSGR